MQQTTLSPRAALREATAAIERATLSTGLAYPRMTRAQAYARALNDNPALYGRWKKAKLAVAKLGS